MLLITFDFFLYAVAELVWMESVSVALKVRDSLTTRFLREIRFDRREQGRFSAKPPAGPILHEREARKYLCYCNKFIRSIPVSSDGKKVGEKVIGEKHREKHRAVNMQLGCVHGRSATLPKQNTAKHGATCRHFGATDYHK